MKLLTLIRHAKSSWRDSDLPDFERPPNKRGRRDAPLMAKRLAASGQLPELLISSPAERAATTAGVMAAALGWEKEHIVWERSLYLASTGQLLDAVLGLDDGIGHAALVGHNPGITNLADVLADARIDNVPTCGVVRLRLAIESWREARYGCGTVIDFDYPKREPAPASR